MGLKVLAVRIGKVVDFFYLPPFRHILPLETFRYAVLGGMNLLYGIVQYWFIYNFILFQRDVTLSFGGFPLTVSSPVAAFCLNFVITFFTGFWLMRNVAFRDGKLSGSRQIVRYAMVVAINILVNYSGLKFLVLLGVYPSIANALIQPVTVVISYLLNRHFSFR